MKTLRRLMDWLPLIVLGVVCFSLGKSCQRTVEYGYPVPIKMDEPVKVPEPKISLGEKLRGTREAKPEAILEYPEIAAPIPREGILSVDWDRGRLSFLSDSAREYIYRLPRNTYMFSVRPRDPGFMVKYRRALWERRLVLGALYPLDAFARADITFGRVFLQGEVTTKDWRVGVGWRIF